MFFNKRFELKGKYHLFRLSTINIFVDMETGVNYIVVNGGMGLSGITPLLDKNGNIVIDKIKKIPPK